jgi:hypothetical protein
MELMNGWNAERIPDELNMLLSYLDRRKSYRHEQDRTEQNKYPPGDTDKTEPSSRKMCNMNRNVR